MAEVSTTKQSTADQHSGSSIGFVRRSRQADFEKWCETNKLNAMDYQLKNKFMKAYNLAYFRAKDTNEPVDLSSLTHVNDQVIFNDAIPRPFQPPRPVRRPTTNRRRTPQVPPVSPRRSQRGMVPIDRFTPGPDAFATDDYSNSGASVLAAARRPLQTLPRPDPGIVSSAVLPRRPTRPAQDATYSAQDILMGRRGTVTYKHQGNIDFRSFLAGRRDEYVGATFERRTHIIEEVIEAVRVQGRKFLVLRDSGEWTEATHHEAYEKVRLTFRETPSGGVSLANVTELDVLTGRSFDGRNEHAGNVYLRDLVKENVVEYQQAEAKKDVVKQVVEAIKSRGGRFLEMSGPQKRWEEIEDKSAMSKVGRMLRG